MTLNYALKRTAMALLQIGLVVLAIYLWQVFADKRWIDPFFFGTPVKIWDYLRVWGSSNQPRFSSTGTTLWQDTVQTCIDFGLGYLIGTVSGVAFGLLLGTVRIVREVFDPFLAFMNAVPRLVLLPILVVMFGFGEMPKVALVWMVIFFVVVTQISTGVQETPRNLLNNAKALGASGLDLVRAIYVPSLAIWVLATARLVVGFAIQAAVAAEFIGSAKGLGFRLTDGQAKFNANEMFASFVVVLLLALAVDITLGIVEKRVTRWMPVAVS